MMNMTDIDNTELEAIDGGVLPGLVLGAIIGGAIAGLGDEIVNGAIEGIRAAWND